MFSNVLSMRSRLITNQILSRCHYQTLPKSHRFINRNIGNKATALLTKKHSRFKKTIKYISIFTGGCILTVSGIISYLYQTDEGIRRSLYFSYKSIYPSYEYYMANDIETKQILHKKYSIYFLDLVLQMGGYYIKMAQTLCGMGVLPDEYEKTFDILLDQIPQKDYDLIESIIKTELNIFNLNEIFEYIDIKCIGAGSIGQVHKARLNKQYIDKNNINIKDIVIKVQYPNVKSYF
eukprot:334565_1